MDETLRERKDFFISYSNTDRNWAEWISWQLEEEGYTLTLQAWDLLPGSNFILDKENASKNSKRIILILSQSYLDTDSVVSEWTAFFQNDPKTLLPVFIQECKPGGFLASIAPCDLVGLNEAEARERLLTSVKGKRNKPIDPPRFPIKHTITQEKEPAFPPFPSTRKRPIGRHLPMAAIPIRRQRAMRQNSSPYADLSLHEKLSSIFHVKPHWLVFIGMGMLILLILWSLGSAILMWGRQRLDDIQYGYPRTYQTNAVVDHGDSLKNPSYFVAMNLNRQAVVSEFMGGDPSKEVTYITPVFIAGNNGELAPVTVEFRDVTDDGKVDMLVHIHLPDQDQVAVFVNDGTKFRPSNSNDKINL